MKNQKIQFKIDDWVFFPYEDKFVLHGEDIIIDNRLSKLLHFLCENPNIVFSRDELINEVWNGSILTDQVITQAIFELRKILKQHGNHPYGYIVTVPKRGYKLDATVEQVVDTSQQLLESVFNNPVDDTQAQVEEFVEPVESIEPIEAVENPAVDIKPVPTVATTKFTRQTEDSGTQEENQNNTPVSPLDSSKPLTPPTVEHNPKSPVKKRLLATFAFSAIAVAVITSYIHVNETNKTMSVTEPPSIAQESAHAPSYLSLEPRYIHVVIDESVVDDNFKVGLSKVLLDFLKTYKNFRVIYGGPASSLAANEIKFAVSTKQNQDYLEIEYTNRISGHKHLDRKYNLSASMLKASLNRSLDDILDSFDIDIDKRVISNLVDELPDDEIALESVLASYGASYHDYTHERALDLIKQAEEHSPNNPYIISTGYVYNMAYLYLRPTQDMTKKISELNDAASKRFKEFASTGSLTPKVLEAMAMMALSKDNPLEAKAILQSIPHQRKTVLFYVLNAKVAELIGNRDSAEEFYYHAMLEASSTQVLNLSEVLFFNSDLSDIKQKIQTSRSNDSV